MMPSPSPHALETAATLLSLHGGSCSVQTSTYIGQAFLAMGESGEVTITDGGTPGFINVYKKGYKGAIEKKQIRNP